MLERHSAGEVAQALNENVSFEWEVAVGASGTVHKVSITKAKIEKLLSFQPLIDGLSAEHLKAKNIEIVAVHGEKDRTVPVEDAAYLEAILHNEVVIFPKTDHSFRNRHSELVAFIVERVAEWDRKSRV